MDTTTFHARAIRLLNDHIENEQREYPASSRHWRDPDAINIRHTWKVKDEETGWTFKFQANWFLGSDNCPHHDVSVHATKKGERRHRDCWLEKDADGAYGVV